jgi:dTDP-4-dehydrorhamnose 3,5-epimerase
MIEVYKTPIPDLILVQPKIFADTRGSFVESFNEKTWEKIGIQGRFVQDNQSVSTYGVLRGLHFQKGQYSQTKVLRVAHGRILDVVVDLRPDSPTFKQSYSVELDDKKGLQIVVPQHFAHGFIVLSETATVIYKCDQYYSPQHESGIHPFDFDLKIDWPVPREKIIISEKDNSLPPFKTVIEKRMWEIK